MPGSSSSGNMSPQSTAMRSSPDSTSIMLRPISPSPPRGISRTEGSTKTPFATRCSSYHPPFRSPKFLDGADPGVPGAFTPGNDMDGSMAKGEKSQRAMVRAYKAGYRRRPETRQEVKAAEAAAV